MMYETKNNNIVELNGTNDSKHIQTNNLSMAVPRIAVMVVMEKLKLFQEKVAILKFLYNIERRNII